VWTPTGARGVAAVLKTRVRNSEGQLRRVGELLVTPWHPIQCQGQWVFPHQVADETLACTGSVYSVLLAPSGHPDSHAIEVGGHICVTLGHGIVGGGKDARSHPFFGHYRNVVLALARLQADRSGRSRCAGLRRDSRTGLACGFISAVGGKNRSKGSVTTQAAKKKYRV